MRGRKKLYGFVAKKRVKNIITIFTTQKNYAKMKITMAEISGGYGMEKEFNNLLYLKKSGLLNAAPICHDLFSCKRVFSARMSKWHLYAHDMIEVGMITEGRGFHYILNRAIPCEAGDIYITPADIPHGYFLAGGGERMTVRRLFLDLADWFDEDVARPGTPRYCYGAFHDNAVTACARLDAKTQAEVGSYYDGIVEELSLGKSEWRNAVKAQLSLLLILLGRYMSDTIQNIPNMQQKEWRLVSPAIRMMHERFAESALTLEAIADTLYVSKSHLSRVFGSVMGKSFSQYLRNIRLFHACELLKRTDLTVEEVVERCGLRDVPTFYRSFHAYTDKTPHQYRTEHKKTNIKEKTIVVILSEISENLQKGKAKVVKELVQQAVDEGSSPEQILNEGLLAGMSIIGEKFKNNEVYVPEVLVAARAMNMGMQILKPLLAANGVKAVGKVCVGTVQGDLHDIGKNLVCMMLEGKGLEVIDLGNDVPPEVFVQTAKEQNCQVICCSALLTTTMGMMESVVKAAEDAGIRDKVKIMVGGAPVNESFCKQIGADCYTVDAASAADAAVALCKEVQGK